MSIREYISLRFASFGVRLSEADFIDISLTESLNINDSVTLENKESVEKAYVQYIPTALTAPIISEGGMRVEVDKDGLREYYKIMCYRLGLENRLLNTIKDATDTW